MKPVTSAGLTISLSLLPYPERSETVGKGILKGNWPGGLETPTAAENSTAPTEGNVADSNRPRRPMAALGAELPLTTDCVEKLKYSRRLQFTTDLPSGLQRLLGCWRDTEWSNRKVNFEVRA